MISILPGRPLAWNSSASASENLTLLPSLTWRSPCFRRRCTASRRKGASFPDRPTLHNHVYRSSPSDGEIDHALDQNRRCRDVRGRRLEQLQEGCRQLLAAAGATDRDARSGDPLLFLLPRADGADQSRLARAEELLARRRRLFHRRALVGQRPAMRRLPEERAEHRLY